MVKRFAFCTFACTLSILAACGGRTTTSADSVAPGDSVEAMTGTQADGDSGVGLPDDRGGLLEVDSLASKDAATEVKDVVPETTVPDIACVPDCDGRQCGADGCGGKCGECPCSECSPQATACDEAGQCIHDCESCDCQCTGLCIAYCSSDDKVCLASCGVEDFGIEYPEAFWLTEWGQCLMDAGWGACGEDERVDEQTCMDEAYDECYEQICTCNSGDKSCSDFVECISGCDAGFSCINVCMHQRSDKAMALYGAMTDCLEAAGYFVCEGDLDCVDGAWEACSTEVDACLCDPDCPVR